MELKLVVLAGAKEGTQIPLKKDKFLIGRSTECTLRAGSSAISDADTSEKHADKSAGKHPLANQWQHTVIMEEEIVRSLFSGRPGMNFGIKTGTAAGIWVLDVDPKHGGDLHLAELEKEHGALPDTYTVLTGSGGRHLFFSLPHDFTPTNSKGSLPNGLDVRGEGGFVVGAPSRSGVGGYEVLLDLPVVEAPEWLLEMIRPRMPAEVEINSPGICDTRPSPTVSMA